MFCLMSDPHIERGEKASDALKGKEMTMEQ